MRGCIICIGNRFIEHDCAGLDVHEWLQRQNSLPTDIELVEGGMGGLNLLPYLERGGRVVFVDSVQGYGSPGEIVVLDRQQITAPRGPVHYDHGAGLDYLLAVLPEVCEGEMAREIYLVGLEIPSSDEAIEQAAGLSLRLASHGL